MPATSETVTELYQIQKMTAHYLPVSVELAQPAPWRQHMKMLNLVTVVLSVSISVSHNSEYGLILKWLPPTYNLLQRVITKQVPVSIHIQNLRWLRIVILSNQALIICLVQVSISVFSSLMLVSFPWCNSSIAEKKSHFFLCFKGNQSISALNYSSLSGGNRDGDFDGDSLVSGPQVTNGLASWQEVLRDPTTGILYTTSWSCSNNFCKFWPDLHYMLLLNSGDCL